MSKRSERAHGRGQAAASSMIILGVLGALLTAELTASLGGMPPLCGTEACSLASQAVAIAPPVLFGAALAWVLALMTALPSCSPLGQPSRSGVYSMLLVAGAAFDGVLLGFLLKTGLPCTVCLVVAAGVVLLLLAELFRCTSSGLGGVMAWGAAIVASLLLAGPGAPMQVHPALAESAVVRYMPQGGGSRVGREYHLYVRYGCGHCEDLLEGLSRATITGAGTWFVHTVNALPDEALARRDAYAEANSNLGLRAVLAAKHASPDVLPEIGAADVELLERKGSMSAAEVVRFGMDGVPGLILREPGMTIVVTGSLPILNALQNWGVIRL